MQPFRIHRGRTVALPRANVDTDQIIPKQFLKAIGRSDFGPCLFSDWRYLKDGRPDPEFELNRHDAEGASVLLTGSNFGCGSSREHAAWALADFGFRVIIALSFADIFQANCYQNGLLPVVLPEHAVQELFARSEKVRGYELTIDLESQRVYDAAGFDQSFPIDPYRREMLILGLDEIGRTLQDEQRIAEFERRRVGGRSEPV